MNSTYVAQHASPIRVGFWPRFFAMLIDFFVVFLLMRVINGVLVAAFGESASVVTTALILLLLPVYSIYFWVVMGATPGKMALRLRVVTDNYGKPDLSEAVLRLIGYGLSALPLYLGFLWIAMDKNNQGWHDKLAGTRVVRVPKGATIRSRSTTQRNALNGQGQANPSLLSRLISRMLNLTADVDLMSIDTWDSDDQYAAAIRLNELSQEIQQARSLPPRAEAASDTLRTEVRNWEHRLQSLRQQLLSNPPQNDSTEGRSIVSRRKRDAQVTTWTDEIQRNIVHIGVEIAEPEISERVILAAFPQSIDRAHTSVEVAQRTAYITIPAPVNDIPTYTTQTRQTKKGTSVTTRQRPAKDINEDYKNLVANRARNTINLAFSKVPGLDHVVVSIMQPAIHSTRGHHYRRCILSTIVDRTTWESIVHSNVTSENALRNFEFRFRYSSGTFELQEVAPIAAAGMPASDGTPLVLHDMDPIDFEVLIKELLTRMGYQATLTKTSGDGGIDVDAFNPEPIVGGRVVVQCKRYKANIGSPVIRDLFGAMTAAGVSKGILVTTSDFTAEARAFADGKPLELINGAELTQLLGKHGIAVAEIA